MFDSPMVFFNRWNLKIHTNHQTTFEWSRRNDKGCSSAATGNVQGRNFFLYGRGAAHHDPHESFCKRCNADELMLRAIKTMVETILIAQTEGVGALEETMECYNSNLRGYTIFWMRIVYYDILAPPKSNNETIAMLLTIAHFRVLTGLQPAWLKLKLSIVK